jgi:hypothetical protein
MVVMEPRATSSEHDYIFNSIGMNIHCCLENDNIYKSSSNTLGNENILLFFRFVNFFTVLQHKF